jgi:hypothetical protein
VSSTEECDNCRGKVVNRDPSCLAADRGFPFFGGNLMDQAGRRRNSLFGGVMENVRFAVHDRASQAVSLLNPSERKALEAAIAPLVDLPPRDWEKKGAIRLRLPEPTFMLKFEQRLRAIIRPTSGGQPELLDLVSHETLQLFREADAARKTSAPRRVTSTP